MDSAAGMDVLMNERLVRVETKLDVLLQGMPTQIAGHDERIRSLEATVTALKVKVGLISGGTGAGALAALITYFTSR